VASRPGYFTDPVESSDKDELVDKLVRHPLVSPLFLPDSSLTGFPPMLIQNGDAECLRDEGLGLARRLSQAGVKVKHGMCGWRG
jgi:acetyl esterase/lipase